MEWQQSFRDFVLNNRLFSQDEKILLAVSGGRDSMLMAKLFAMGSFQFGIAHCNFGLRGTASDEDERFVYSLAETLGAQYHSIRFDTENYAQLHGLSVQMAARELRYDWFESIREAYGYRYVAVAHHRNDSIETVLLNLCRGTGLRGLQGILPARQWVVRPLLYLTRDDIDRAVKELGVPYREDASNLSDKYARNRIRMHVIPALKMVNPSLEQTFEQNTERFKEAVELMDIVATQTRERLLKPALGGGYDIAIVQLLALRPLKLLTHLLFGRFGFSESVLDDLLVSLEKGTHPGKCFQSRYYVLVIDREHLLLRALERNEKAATAFLRLGENKCWNGHKISLESGTGEIPQNEMNRVAIDGARLIFPLCIRAWQKGDRFHPFGMSGKKKLSDFFISIKIPLLQKQDIPIIVNGDGQIIWVAPFRLDNRFRISPKTEKVLTLAYEKL